ncbi:Patterned Expression Site [Caenorhabditis elegans]|uniref:Patterned Expression Site n=1 Tax=Caenorhabditis elegans TaxID=6239 RepID=A0A4V0INE6_CAEEL|nr:Patterned Expression Site [Caenorhabditis elegans]VTW47560.1 Patterned Expression Site [Caenorhabditis elegans]
MLYLTLFCVFLLFSPVFAKYPLAELRVTKGPPKVDDIPSNEYIFTQYTIGETYTFEVHLDETTQNDYIINWCNMNGDQLIGARGCVNCNQCGYESVETHSYNRPGAIKRTLVPFVAAHTTINFECEIEMYICSGCAERSCETSPLALTSKLTPFGKSTTVALMYPPAGYAMPMGAYPIPIPPNIYPTPPFGGFHMPPHSPPHVQPPPVVNPGAVGTYTGYGGAWPWWVWLLIILLLLLLLCCLLALCFAAFMKRKREKKAAAVTVVDGKDCATGTDRVSVTCVGTDTQDIVKVQPAVVLGADSLQSHHQQHHQHNQYSRNQAEYDQGSVMAGGTYSLREGMIHEGYTRTLPRESYSTNDRYASRDRFERQSQDKYTDRSSYRNFAYERDMGRVEPMDGFDEVETRERTYCLSDDDQEIVEKNVKRTHTTRYVTESREYDQDHDNEERMRGDEYHHATYTHSLPV